MEVRGHGGMGSDGVPDNGEVGGRRQVAFNLNPQAATRTRLNYQPRDYKGDCSWSVPHLTQLYTVSRCDIKPQEFTLNPFVCCHK